MYNYEYVVIVVSVTALQYTHDQRLSNNDDHRQSARLFTYLADSQITSSTGVQARRLAGKWSYGGM